MNRLKSYGNVALAALMSIALISCGGDPKKDKGPEINVNTPEVNKTPSTADDGIVRLVLNSNDQMQYDKNEFRVSEGDQVQLTLNHTGSLPKEVMGHNFVLLKQGTDVAAFAGEAVNAKENDYIPESDAIIVHTQMIGGGQSTSITFEAPAKGEYEYICSFPGHYGVMRGVFIVE